MKKIYLILFVVVLLGAVGTVVFFVVKKKKDRKKSSSKASVIAPKEKAAIVPPKTEIAPNISQKPLIRESLEMDIKVSEVDTRNRRFDYSMHYKGIRHKGLFEDGVTSVIVQIDKGFGSFLIQQPIAMQREGNSVSSKSGAQKVRGGKGAAVANKTGATGSNSIASINQNDWVVLSILDKKGQTLKEVHANLRTGVQKSKNINRTVVTTI